MSRLLSFHPVAKVRANLDFNLIKVQKSRPAYFLLIGGVLVVLVYLLGKRLGGYWRPKSALKSENTTSDEQLFIAGL